MRHDYNLIASEIKEFAEAFTEVEYLLMRSAVASRYFRFHIDGHMEHALVPFADMLNHKEPRETNWYYC